MKIAIAVIIAIFGGLVITGQTPECRVIDYPERYKIGTVDFEDGQWKSEGKLIGFASSDDEPIYNLERCQ